MSNQTLPTTSTSTTNNNNTNQQDNNSPINNDSSSSSSTCTTTNNLGAYSNDDLFKDCERLIQQQPLKPSNPFRDLKFHLLHEIWSAISAYIHQQIEHLKSVSINNIGRFSFLTKSNHSNTTTSSKSSSKVIFLLSEAFVRDFNLKRSSNSFNSRNQLIDNSIPCLEVNYFLIAQQCSTRKEIVNLALKMFRNRLGEMMASGRKVLLDFEWIGQLKCDKRIVGDFEFVEKFRREIQSKNSIVSTSSSSSSSVMKSMNRVMTRRDLKLLSKMRESYEYQSSIAHPPPPPTSRSMIHHQHSNQSFTIIKNNQNGRPHTSSSSGGSNSGGGRSVHNNGYARGNGVNAVRNLNSNQILNSGNNQSSYEPHPPSMPRPSTLSMNHHQYNRLTRESLDTFNKMNNQQSNSNNSHQHHSLINGGSNNGSIQIPSDYISSQFSPSINYGPHDNGFRQPNATATRTVMDLAVKRFEKEIEHSKRNQQEELDGFYRQLIHNVCANQELRRQRREEASNIQNQLLNQMNHTGAKRQVENGQYCNFFLDERDGDLNQNVNALLMGFKKPKQFVNPMAMSMSSSSSSTGSTHLNNNGNNGMAMRNSISSRDRAANNGNLNNNTVNVSKSLPSVLSLQAMKPLQKIMSDDNNPIEKGLRIPDKNELLDYYNKFINN